MTCQQRRKDVSLSLLPTMQLMAPRYGTQESMAWLLTTVSSSLSLSWIAHGRSAEGRVRVRTPCVITSSGLARRRLLRSRYRTGPVDTEINSEGLLRLFTKFSTPVNYPLYGIWPMTSLFDVPPRLILSQQIWKHICFAWDSQTSLTAAPRCQKL